MATAGRPRQGATPERTEWQIQATVSVATEAVTARYSEKPPSWSRPMCWRPHQELIRTYKEQHSVERGFSFLKDLLFLASSVS